MQTLSSTQDPPPQDDAHGDLPKELFRDYKILDGDAKALEKLIEQYEADLADPSNKPEWNEDTRRAIRYFKERLRVIWVEMKKIRFLLEQGFPFAPEPWEDPDYPPTLEPRPYRFPDELYASIIPGLIQHIAPSNIGPGRAGPSYQHILGSQFQPIARLGDFPSLSNVGNFTNLSPNNGAVSPKKLYGPCEI